MQGKPKAEAYDKIKNLGKGAYGTAMLCKARSSGKEFCVKQMDISNMDEQEKKDTLQEAKLMEVCNHPNIVGFQEVYKTKRGRLCIVMEYCDGGDLAKSVKYHQDNRQKMCEDLILDMFTQVLMAWKYLHTRRVLHRDIKSQNIFLM